ncbi:MAG TPA: hypothetical protein VHP83_16340 [Aggregatilineaceae bacterium]|nr:hypothetical protein [Aggregatilineaceae bacterium]
MGNGEWKRFLRGILLLILVVGVSGCGEEKEEDDDSGDAAVVILGEGRATATEADAGSLPPEAFEVIREFIRDSAYKQNQNWDGVVLTAQRANGPINYQEEWCVIVDPPFQKYEGMTRGTVVSRIELLWQITPLLMTGSAYTVSEDDFLKRGCTNWQE